MLRGVTRICLAISFPIVAVTTLVGCNGGGSGCADVTLGGVTACVDPDAGAQSLASTRWVLVDDSGNPQVTLVFDAGGNLVEFADSALVANLLGANIILDDEPHGTGIDERLKYSAIAFEVVGEPVGGIREFTLLANIDLFFATGLPFIGNVDVAAGTANATGTIEGNIMTGVFIFEVEIDAGIRNLAEGLLAGLLPPELPLDNFNQTFNFTAVEVGGGL